MKAGTTALTNYLCGHADVFCPDVKEPNHFCLELHRRGIRRLHPFTRDFDLSRYLADPHRSSRFFEYMEDYEQYCSLYAKRFSERYALDGSTTYLNSPEAADAIRARCARAKIIILVRDPAARAWSEFQMNQRIGVADGDFARALEREADELRAGRAPLFERYASCGLYDQHIARFVAAFGDANVLIANASELSGEGFHARLWSFLDLPPLPGLVQPANKSVGPRFSWVNRLLHRSGLKYRVARILPAPLKRFLAKTMYKQGAEKMPAEARALFERYFSEAADICRAAEA